MNIHIPFILTCWHCTLKKWQHSGWSVRDLGYVLVRPPKKRQHTVANTVYAQESIWFLFQGRLCLINYTGNSQCKWFRRSWIIQSKTWKFPFTPIFSFLKKRTSSLTSYLYESVCVPVHACVHCVCASHVCTACVNTWVKDSGNSHKSLLFLHHVGPVRFGTRHLYLLSYLAGLVFPLMHLYVYMLHKYVYMYTYLCICIYLHKWK